VERLPRVSLRFTRATCWTWAIRASVAALRRFDKPVGVAQDAGQLAPQGVNFAGSCTRGGFRRFGHARPAFRFAYAGYGLRHHWQSARETKVSVRQSLSLVRPDR